jgi:uncharacterized lipoprotein
MRLGRIAQIASFALLLGLAGCHPFRWLGKIGGTCHDTKPYMSAKSIPPLSVPAGLDPADTGSSLKIPRLNEPAPPARKATDPCLDEPPAFAKPRTPAPQARSIIRAPSGDGSAG